MRRTKATRVGCQDDQSLGVQSYSFQNIPFPLSSPSFSGRPAPVAHSAPVLPRSVRSVPSRPVPSRPVPFRSVPFRSVPFRSVPLRSVSSRHVTLPSVLRRSVSVSVSASVPGLGFVPVSVPSDRPLYGHRGTQFCLPRTSDTLALQERQFCPEAADETGRVTWRPEATAVNAVTRRQLPSAADFSGDCNVRAVWGQVGSP